MRLRTPLVMLLGAALGGLVGWLAFAWSNVRDDPVEGVGHVTIGAVWGFFAAVVVLTRGTCDFSSQAAGKEAAPHAGDGGGARSGPDTTECGASGAGFDPTQLSALDHHLATAWRTASAELGIGVIAPFDLAVGQAVFRYGALVAGFGTAKGTLLRAMPEAFHPDQCGAIWDAAQEAGYGVSNLSPLLCYFDRDEFIRFLSRLGWHGPPAEAPPWYSGCAEGSAQ